MDANCNIYGLVDPLTQELRYVGKTVRPIEIRLKHHFKPKELNKVSHKSSWLKSLRDRGLRPEVFLIEEVAADLQDEAERFWISYFKSLGANLTNMTAGGGGGLTKITRLSKEHIEKMYAARMARLRAGITKLPPLSEEAKKKISARRQGMKFSETHRENISKGKKGKRVLTDEQYKNIGAKRKGMGCTRETRIKISLAKKGVLTPAMKEQTERLRSINTGRKLSQEHINALRSGVCKLTEEKVREIKRLLAVGELTNSQIAQLFNVSPRNILSIKKGETWKNVN